MWVQIGSQAGSREEPAGLVLTTALEPQGPEWSHGGGHPMGGPRIHDILHVQNC